MYSYSAIQRPVLALYGCMVYRQRGTGLLRCMAPYINFLLYAGLYGEGDVWLPSLHGLDLVSHKLHGDCTIAEGIWIVLIIVGVPREHSRG